MVVNLSGFSFLLGTFLILFSTGLRAGELVNHGDLAVLDRSTSLIWQKSEGGKKNWEEALVYCEDLNLSGFNDWRLPDVNELRSLVDRSQHNPAIDKRFFPDVVSSIYWSSSTSPNNNEYGWFVSFHMGNVNNYSKSYAYYVRCVRGGSPNKN